jgi:hypothetical protein
MLTTNPRREGRETGAAQVLFLISLTTAASVSMATVFATSIKDQREQRLRESESRTSLVAAALRDHYREHLAFPGMLDALATGGRVEREELRDPFAPAMNLEYRATDPSGRLVLVYSRGENRVDESGLGDDIVCALSRDVLGASVTRQRWQLLRRAITTHARVTRSETDLAGPQPAWFTDMDALLLDPADSSIAMQDWVRGVGRAYLEGVDLALGIAANNGLATAAQAAVVANLRRDYDALSFMLGLSGPETPSTQTVRAIRAAGLPPAFELAAVNAQLGLRELQRLAVGAPDLAWRIRHTVKLGGFRGRAVHAMLEAQDGDPGLESFLATYSALQDAITDLGLTSSMRLDGWGVAFAIEPLGKEFGLRCAGPDRLAWTSDDVVYDL